MAECFSRSKRMAQLEDELAGQQRQLDTMRKTLANVVDVATHRHYKDQVAARLANKADLDLLDKNYNDLMETSREQLREALANKADAVAVEQCQRELSVITQDRLRTLESEQAQLSQALERDRAGAQDVRTTFERLLSGSVAEVDALGLHHKALAASVADKANARALEEQGQRLAKTEINVKQLERNAAEAAREQLSATIGVEMSAEVMHKASAVALQKQMHELEATRAEVAALEHRVGEMHGEQLELSLHATTKQEEWYKEKDHEQYLLAVSRKDRQDQQLVQALSKKADVAWYEQQKAIIDATQVSLTALNGGHQELHLQLMDKVDTHTLEKQQLRLQQEIAQARQDTTDVARKLERHREHLDMARAQLLEMIRQQGEVEVSLSMKADKAGLEQQEEQLEGLRVKVLALEQRQEVTFREVGHLQDQLSSAARHASAHNVHKPHALDYTSGGMPPATPPGMKAILQPPSSPREHHHGRRHKAKSPYMKKL